MPEGPVRELEVDECESKLLRILLGDTGLAMASCDGKGQGIIVAILRFGTVRKTSSDVGCVNPFGDGKGRASRSASNFLSLVLGDLTERVDAGEWGRGGWWLRRAHAP
jgi:hypothetical protein